MLACLWTCFVAASPALAQIVALDPGQKLEDTRSGWLPYAFSTESLGTTLGVAAFSSAPGRQPVSSLIGTAFGTSNESWGAVGSMSNVQLGRSRWFLDSFIMLAHYTDSRSTRLQLTLCWRRRRSGYGPNRRTQIRSETAAWPQRWSSSPSPSRYRIRSTTSTTREMPTTTR